MAPRSCRLRAMHIVPTCQSSRTRRPITTELADIAHIGQSASPHNNIQFVYSVVCGDPVDFFVSRPDDIRCSKVLALFRSLHRTRQSVFRGDEDALIAARTRINEEFQRNKDETDPEEVKQMIKVGEDVEVLMRKTIVQAKLTEKGTYRIRITEDTLREDNAPLPGLKGNTPKKNESTETR